MLEGLFNLGFDPDRPHTVEFFFYFPSEENAKLAVSVMEKEGFETNVYPPDDRAEWLCVAHRKMLPEHYELRELRQWFNSITEEMSGKYDIWGTGIAQ